MNFCFKPVGRQVATIPKNRNSLLYSNMLVSQSGDRRCAYGNHLDKTTHWACRGYLDLRFVLRAHFLHTNAKDLPCKATVSLNKRPSRVTLEKQLSLSHIFAAEGP